MNKKNFEMNKKGDLIHWIFFAFLIAVGIFFAFNSSNILQFQPKAEWHFDFLKNNYLPAQKDMLKNDILARQIIIDTAKDLAQKGGFEEGISSLPCGELNGYPYWNKQDKFCFPKVDNLAINLIKVKLKESTKNDYGDIKFNKNMIIVEGKPKTIKTKAASYIYDTSFAMDISYDFDEYYSLHANARNILQCRGEADIKKCIGDKQLKNWYFNGEVKKTSLGGSSKTKTPCGALKDIPAGETQLVFCVVSAYNENIKYNLALDLS